MIVTPDTWLERSPKDIVLQKLARRDDVSAVRGDAAAQRRHRAATACGWTSTSRPIADTSSAFTGRWKWDFRTFTARRYTRLNEKGELEVEQRITNETDEVLSFKCYLYPARPSRQRRKRMMMHVEDHGRGVDVKTFRIYDGDQLLGQTLFLRAEEVNGSRILNFNVIAQP